MRTTKSFHTGRTDTAWREDTDEVYGAYEIFRVDCPECGQPIALLADEDALPQHALCPTRWNPFGLTVCAGSGSAAADAPPTAGAAGGQEDGAAALLTLPAGLDWRRQPFSHAGRRGSRPMSLAGSARRT